MRALEVRGLRKSYGNFTVLKGIDLYVEEGEVFAILGPNGAGKTTLIRVLAEGLSYDSGAIRVFGEPLSKKTARFIGYAPQESLAYDDLTVRENLAFYADLYDVPGGRVDELIERFKLPAKKKAKELSGGFKKRMNLAVALIYDPKILILDEPSTGLDVPSRRELWELTREFREDGKTVLLATHHMEEAEVLADRVAIMNEGQVIAAGTPEELRDLAGNESVIHVEGILRGAAAILREFRAIERENALRVSVEDAKKALPQIVEILVENGSEIRSIRVEEPTLEDVFLKLTGRGLE